MDPMHFYAVLEASVSENDRYLEIERYFTDRDEARRRRHERVRRALGRLRAHQVREATGVRVTPTLADQG